MVRIVQVLASGDSIMKKKSMYAIKMVTFSLLAMFGTSMFIVLLEAQRIGSLS